VGITNSRNISSIARALISVIISNRLLAWPPKKEAKLYGVPLGNVVPRNASGVDVKRPVPTAATAY
jgi:hypothetical protein